MLLLLFCLIGTSQERFNVRFNSEFPNTILTSVIEVEDGYVSTGFLGDSAYPNATPMIFSKFDFAGNQLFQNTYGGEESLQNRLFSSQNPDLQFLNDSVLMHSGITYDENWVRQGYLAKFNIEGDTLETIRFYSPNISEGFEFIATRRAELAFDNNFLVLSNVVGDETNNDMSIQKYTPEGELLWTYEYATEQDPDFIYTIIPTEDGGGVSIAYNFVEFGVSARNHFFRYNSNGDSVWEFFTNPEDDFGSVSDAILDEEFIICSTSHRRWEPVDDHTPRVLKIDTLGNIAWKTKIWNDDYDLGHRTRQLIKSHDGEGYVIGGNHGTTVVGEPFSSSAFLAKVSTEGELMWQRKYKYFDLGNDQHELYDLRATSDGGFIFCGEAKGVDEDNPDVIGPYQQGWLVKVDEYGCLVEGCHLSDNVSEIEMENKEYFKASPIPASDFLNIYQTQQVSPLAIYELYDLQGRLIKAIPVADSGTTLMVDISDLNSGNYVLSLREGNQLLQQQKMIVQ